MAKIEPLKLHIDGRDVTFGVIGFRAFVDATKKIREYKEQAFSRVVGSISRDPLTAATAAASAIDGYMAGMIVSEGEVKQWMFSPEGEYFLFEYAIKKGSHDATDEAIAAAYDGMSAADRRAVSEFLVKCLLKDDYDIPAPA